MRLWLVMTAARPVEPLALKDYAATTAHIQGTMLRPKLLIHDTFNDYP